MAKRVLELVVVGNTTGAEKALKQLNGSVARVNKGFGATAKSSLKFGAAAVGITGLGAAISAVASKTIGFDKSMRNVNSIAQLNEKQFGKLEKAVLGLAGKTAQAPDTLAKGLYDLVSSGFNAHQSMTILKSSAQAATAGLTTTEVSTKALAAVLNAYHRPAKDAADISDVLFQTVNRGVLSFEDLASNIGTVLPFAASLGVNLNQVGASISTLTKQGISGELSITFLKNAMVSFLKPSDGMSEAIKKTGFASGEALIKAKGFQGALEAVKGTTDGSKKAMAALFPNIRALTAALGLTGQNAKSAAGDLHAFQNTSGATATALSQQSKSISFQWNKVKATFDAVAIQLGLKLVPAVTVAMAAVSRFIEQAKKGQGTAGQLRSIVVAVASAFRVAAGAVSKAMPVFRVAIAVFAEQVKVTVAVERAIFGFYKAVASSMVKAASAVKSGARAIIGALKGLPGQMLNVGKDAVQGLIDGIMSKVSGVANAAKSIAGAVPKTVKKILNILSPSKVMFDIGRFTAEGYVKGLLSAKDMVTDGLNHAFVYPIDAAIAALNNKKTALQTTWDNMDAAAQRSGLVGAIGKAKNTTSLDASTHFGLSGGHTTTAGKSAKGGSVLATILAVGRKMGASPKQLLAATETGIVESGLKNLNFGDADSKGWRQERTSIYGNTHATSVVLSAQDFFKEAMGMDHKGLSAGDLAANVQRPRQDLRGKYAGVQAQALGLLGNNAPTRNQLVAATKRRGADQSQVQGAIKALKDFDDAAKRARTLAKIDIQVAHLEQLKAFKGAIADIRTGLKAMAQSAADAFRSLREGEINKTHDAAIAAIGDSADAKELARLQADDAVKADAKTTQQLNQALADAIKAGDVQAQQDAQDAIDAYARQKREDELAANLAAATKKADDDQTVAMNGLDKEVADFQSALDTKLTAEANHLAQRKESYATFLKNIQAVAKQYGLNAADVIGASPDQEAAVSAGPGSKAPAWVQAWASIPGNDVASLAAATPWATAWLAKNPGMSLPGRAVGGPVSAGHPYIVGERGQELFVPGTSGRIVPNAGNKMGGGGVTLNHYGDNVFRTGTDHDRWANKLAFKLATA